MPLIRITASIALVSIVVLVFVGATVRATGAGLGCPDWPTCWGRLVPPTSASQIDVERLDIPRFKRYAERHGIDPDTVTRDTVLAGFNAVHTWTEFVNRLTSLPLGLATLLLAVISFRATQRRGWIIALSWLCLADVLFNAWMGAVVVRSGLKPGIITLHMALAFVLICLLVTVREFAAKPAAETGPIAAKKGLRIATWIFFGCLFAEGILGSQVREMTDQLAKAAGDIPRDEWIGALASTVIFQVHRSFSWILLIAAGAIWWLARSDEIFAQKPAPKLILGLVAAMMLLGVVLAHISVFPAVQILHVGLTAILLAVTWQWLLHLHSRGASQAGTKGTKAA